jgi:hypothetical protein
MTSLKGDNMKNKDLNNNDKEKLAIFLAKKLDIMCKDRKVDLIDLNNANSYEFFEYLITFFNIDIYEAFDLISYSLENIIISKTVIEGSNKLSAKDIIEYEQTLLETYNEPENQEPEISSIKM